MLGLLGAWTELQGLRIEQQGKLRLLRAKMASDGCGFPGSAPASTRSSSRCRRLRSASNEKTERDKERYFVDFELVEHLIVVSAAGRQTHKALRLGFRRDRAAKQLDLTTTLTRIPLQVIGPDLVSGARSAHALNDLNAPVRSLYCMARTTTSWPRRSAHASDGAPVAPSCLS